MKKFLVVPLVIAALLAGFSGVYASGTADIDDEVQGQSITLDVEVDHQSPDHYGRFPATFGIQFAFPPSGDYDMVTLYIYQRGSVYPIILRLNPDEYCNERGYMEYTVYLFQGKYASMARYYPDCLNPRRNIESNCCEFCVDLNVRQKRFDKEVQYFQAERIRRFNPRQVEYFQPKKLEVNRTSEKAQSR